MHAWRDSGFFGCASIILFAFARHSRTRSKTGIDRRFCQRDIGPSMNKKDFPIFQNHPDLIYLDTAATAQKPQCVIDAEKNFYEQQYATVHRGIYRLSAEATSIYENARETARAFINAKYSHEIIFTKGTTESINL